MERFSEDVDVLVLPADVSLRLRAVYETTMPELCFGSSPLPMWNAICDRVAALRDLL